MGNLFSLFSLPSPSCLPAQTPFIRSPGHAVLTPCRLFVVASPSGAVPQSRMVIHMVKDSIIETYIPQWSQSLKPGGRMFMTDHNPADGTTSGPRQPILYKFGILPMMSVLPQDTEVARIVAGGFRVLEGPFPHPYFLGGYGAVYAAKGT
jgi:hypothetical protein